MAEENGRTALRTEARQDCPSTLTGSMLRQGIPLALVNLEVEQKSKLEIQIARSY